MFVSKRSLPTVKGYNLKKTIEPVVHCREVPIGTDGKETEQLGKKHMALNTYTPVMKVDPETFVSVYPFLSFFLFLFFYMSLTTSIYYLGRESR
jgi:urease alpha subunit